MNKILDTEENNSSNNHSIFVLLYNKYNLCFHAFYQFTNKFVPVIDKFLAIWKKNINFLLIETTDVMVSMTKKVPR
jgi:hypothetical protein